MFEHFGDFLIHGENCLGWAKMKPGKYFPADPDLADVLGDMDLDFENFYFFHFLDPNFLDFQVPKFPDFQVPIFPDFLKSDRGQAWAGLGPDQSPSPAQGPSPARPGPDFGNLGTWKSRNLESTKSPK